MKGDIKAIISLHCLIKKQTILVGIAIISSCLFWAMTAYDSVFFWEVVWDVVVNVFCIWLMLGSSKQYWELCKRWGLCVCCYLKERAVHSVIKDKDKKQMMELK